MTTAGEPGPESTPGASSTGDGPPPVSKARLLWRVFAYLMLCMICVVTAALLLSSNRYGVLAPLVQILLACAWAAFAWQNWKQVRQRPD